MSKSGPERRKKATSNSCTKVQENETKVVQEDTRIDISVEIGTPSKINSTSRNIYKFKLEIKTPRDIMDC